MMVKLHGVDLSHLNDDELAMVRTALLVAELLDGVTNEIAGGALGLVVSSLLSSAPKDEADFWVETLLGTLEDTHVWVGGGAVH